MKVLGIVALLLVAVGAFAFGQTTSSKSDHGMKKYPGIFSAIVLAAVAAVGCAQSSDKKAGGLATVGPELRWKYETGG
jgi:hypothetical protein